MQAVFWSGQLCMLHGCRQYIEFTLFLLCYDFWCFVACRRASCSGNVRRQQCFIGVVPQSVRFLAQVIQ